MRISEINQVLFLIDEWVQALREENLSEQCRRSGKDFFAFMQLRGVRASYLAKLIINATGLNPRSLWSQADAEILRDAIFRYEASIAVTTIDEKHGLQQTAEHNAKRFWE